MAYIITTSSQDRYHTNSGIERSYAYENYLSNPMVIPPNSKVALESIKYVRLPVFSFKDGASKYGYYWFGTGNVPATPPVALDVTTTHQMPIRFDIASGTYSVDQLAQAIQVSIRGSQYSLMDTPAIVTPELSSNGSFQGFKYQFNQQDLVSTSVRPPQMYHCVAGAGEQTPAPTGAPRYDATTGNITGVRVGGPTIAPASVIFPDNPINPTLGHIIYDISDTGEYNDNEGKPKGGWVCGLTRPQKCAPQSDFNAGNVWNRTGYLGTMTNSMPEWFDKDTVEAAGAPNSNAQGWSKSPVPSYYDYAVCVCPVANKSPVLTVMNVVAGTGANAGTTVRRSIPYWSIVGSVFEHTGPYNMDNTFVPDSDPPVPVAGGNANGGGLPDVAGAGTPAIKNITKFKMIVDGEQVRIQAVCDKYDAGTDAYVVDSLVDLVDYTQAKVSSNSLSPLNQNKWALYPKVSFFGVRSALAPPLEDEQVITIEEFIPAATSLGMSKNLDWYNNNFYSAYTTGSKQSIEAHNRDLDLRVNNKAGQVALPTTRDGSKDVLLSYNQQLIMNGITNGWEPVGYFNPAPTIGPILGWAEAGFTYYGMAGQTGTAPEINYVSPSDTKNTPSAIPEHSLFVRCPTLTQTSHNFGKGGMSKIIYHCPMFNNAGEGTGALFFQPAERVYIDLGNKENINLNQLTMEIVDRNEQYSVDLTGNTTICLHIKQ